MKQGGKKILDLTGYKGGFMERRLGAFRTDH